MGPRWANAAWRNCPQSLRCPLVVSLKILEPIPELGLGWGRRPFIWECIGRSGVLGNLELRTKVPPEPASPDFVSLCCA